MMTLRPQQEVETAAKEAVLLLDSALEEARARLISDGISIKDDSDRTDFPCWSWSVWFEKRRTVNSESVMARIWLSYSEPSHTGEPRNVMGVWIAMIWKRDEQARFRRHGFESFSLEHATNCDLATLVLGLFAEVVPAVVGIEVVLLESIKQDGL